MAVFNRFTAEVPVAPGEAALQGSKLSTACTGAAGRVQQLEQQLRQAQQQKQEAELRLHFATEEAQELRLAKEAAVVEKEQVAVRSERRSQAHEVSIDRALHTQCRSSDSRGGSSSKQPHTWASACGQKPPLNSRGNTQNTL